MTDAPKPIAATVTTYGVDLADTLDGSTAQIKNLSLSKAFELAKAYESLGYRARVCGPVERVIGPVSQPEPQPVDNERVIAELGKLVPKVCWRCTEKNGWADQRRGYHEPLGANSFPASCPASPLHDRIAELRGGSK